MEKQIIISFKETGDETYPLTYTVKVEGDITYSTAINALVKILDSFITNLHKPKNNEENNLHMVEPQAATESTGNGSIDS